MKTKGRCQKIIVILGATATGKSDLAVYLAKKFNGEVVSADSRQVYKGLNIGTGKITKKEMRGIKHHLLDVANPRKQYSVAKYVKEAQKTINDINKRDKLAIICGGTGFYISALLNEIAISSVPQNHGLRKKLANKKATELFTILKKMNPKRASELEHNPSEKNNRHRLIRAIEIAKYSKNHHTLILRDRIKSMYSDKSLKNQYWTLKIGLKLENGILRKKIEERLENRLKKGMIREVNNMHKKGLSWKRMNELGLEYRYITLYLQGKISKTEMITKLQTEIWRYSKRQVTWFKRDKNIKWFLPAKRKTILKETSGFLSSDYKLLATSH